MSNLRVHIDRTMPKADRMAEKAERKRTTAAGASESSVSLSVADIKELFGLMKANDIAELNLEQKGTKIRIVSTHAPLPAQTQVASIMPLMPGMGMISSPAPHPAPAVAAAAPLAEAALPAPAIPQQAAPAPVASAESAVPSNVKTIHSPMVGTFYRAPAPDAAPFVQTGDRVSEETTLCIIEAMKLMNELKAEMKGRIVKILVENGVPVEYNQPLFLIEPA